jgi:hypothetical protein
MLRMAGRVADGLQMSDVALAMLPDAMINHLIASLSSAGDPGDIDRELERYRQFAAQGLTDLALRLFDDPMAGLRMIGERVVPAFARG